MSDYDDDNWYEPSPYSDEFHYDSYRNLDDEDYEDDPDVFEGENEPPLIPKWRMDLEISKYWIWHRLDSLKRWLKWHNHKCKVCGKPATIDGEVCPNCWIPF